MRHTTAAALTACTLFTIGTADVLAQEVTFKPDLQEGATMTYELKSELDVTQEQGETTREESMEHTATLAFTVESVNEAGGAEISMTFDAIAMSIATGDSSESFNWAFTGGDRPDASMGEGINASGFALAGADVSFTVTPDGQVENMSGLDEFMGTIQGESSADVARVGVFTPQRLAEAIEPIFDADGGAGKPREKGANWEETERVELGPVGTLVLNRQYTYLHHADGAAVVLGTLSVKMETPDSPPENAPSVKLSGAQGASAIQWDTTENALKQYGRNETMKTAWTMGEVSIDQMQRSVLTINRAE